MKFLLYYINTIYFLTKEGELINFLTNLFFVVFIINTFIVFYSLYSITDLVFFKNSHNKKFNIPN